MNGVTKSASIQHFYIMVIYYVNRLCYCRTCWKVFAVIAALWFPLRFVSPATVVKTYTLRMTHIFKQIPLHWLMQAAIQ